LIASSRVVYRNSLGNYTSFSDYGCLHRQFSRIAKLPSDGNTPYALLVFAAMLPWSLFSTALSESSALISKDGKNLCGFDLNNVKLKKLQSE
jgi:hypothetical protein